MSKINGARAPNRKVLNDYLRNLYLNVDGVGSFMGVSKLYKAVQEDGTYKVTWKEIQEWLQSFEEYSKHRTVKRVKTRAKVIVSGIDDQFDADLASFDKESVRLANDNIAYLLVVIDIFSRYLWVRPLKNKEAKTVVKAFKDIFKKSNRVPKRIRTDRGREFTSKYTQDYFQTIKVVQMFTGNELQANYVERVIKTLKKRILSYMRHYKTEKYIDVLQNLVNSYNKTWHHGIRERPINVTAKNEKFLWWQMYWPVDRPQNRLRDFLFKKEDYVRISLRKTAFDREYSNKWSGEIFKVSKRFRRQDIPMYRLKDLMGEKIDGTFYSNELQKVPAPRWLEAYVIKSKDNLIKISYKGWPNKFSRWVNKKSLFSDKQLEENLMNRALKEKMSQKARVNPFGIIQKKISTSKGRVRVFYKNLPLKFNRIISESSLEIVPQIK